jgi:glutamate synthase (NADPH/NADH) small chain
MADTALPLARSKDQITANFADAHPPLSAAQAVVAANRCYFCYDAPCIEACPTGIDIPGFIRSISTGNLGGAAHKILDANIFGGSCARVCPTEILCERACVRTAECGEPVDIGALQRVATDWQMAQAAHPFTRAPATGKSIAVIGAGPAGLSCAHGLARLGHDVTVYDAKTKPGGLNEYGIAAYKMADNFAAREVEFLAAIGGITFVYQQRLGDNLHLSALSEKFDAVFIAIGLAGTNRLSIAGEDLPGVRDAVDFIAALRQATDKSTLEIPSRVIVIGGGNTAIDAATQAKLLGADEVTMLYRRGPEHMSATADEQAWAQTHGVNIRFWAKPLQIQQVGTALSVICENGQFTADLILKAVGQIFTGADDKFKERRIAVDGAYRTKIPGVFAGGDCTPGTDLTVHAVQDGKLAARAIDAFLKA